MELKIGENIKRLRRGCGMTQERLAELLGVSYAAVSKWECASTCPDISQLLPLAEIFGVTTDELLGAVPEKREERYREVTDDVKHAWQDGTCDEYVAAARRAVAEFPSSEELRYQLFTALMRRTSACGEPCGNKHELMLEAEHIAKTLLDETKNDDLRIEILPKLVNLYAQGFENREHALCVAESITPVSHCREITKYYALGGKFGRNAIDVLTGNLNAVICNLAQTDPLVGDDEAIEMVRTAEKIIGLIYGDDPGFRYDALERDECAVAWLCHKCGNYSEALDAIESACSYAIAFDDWNRDRKANESVFVRGLYYDESESDILGYSHSENMLMSRLADGFDCIRDTDRFRAVVKRLNEYIENVSQ